MKRVGEDRERHFNQVKLVQKILVELAGVWLAKRRELGLILPVGLPERALMVYVVGVQPGATRLTCHREEVVIKNKKPDINIRLLI